MQPQAKANIRATPRGNQEGQPVDRPTKTIHRSLHSRLRAITMAARCPPSLPPSDQVPLPGQTGNNVTNEQTDHHADSAITQNICPACTFHRIISTAKNDQQLSETFGWAGGVGCTSRSTFHCCFHFRKVTSKSKTYQFNSIIGYWWIQLIFPQPLLTLKRLKKEFQIDRWPKRVWG